MNPALFGPRPPMPDWMPFALAGTATALTAIGVGGAEAVGAACAVGTVTITLFGGLHYELARQRVMRQGESIPNNPEQSRTIPTAPAGYKSVYANDVPIIDTGRVWLDLGHRMVSVKLTGPQLAFLAQRIRAGERRLTFDLYRGDSPFIRQDVERLRLYCPRHGLAVERGRQVTLTAEAARAILEATTTPPGMVRVNNTGFAGHLAASAKPANPANWASG